jgi:adenylate kinase family enzyme
VKHSPIVIELVGPAGAGKSTLTDALRQKGQNVRANTFPSIREARNLPFFLQNALVLLPTLLALYCNRNEGLVSSEQVVWMMILNGWHRQLKKAARQETIILDQGPIYFLAELLRFGPPRFRQIASRWWESVCQEWAKVLDGVVCLDTPDQTLMERIRARKKNHGVKAHSDQWAMQFLAQYRQAQGDVLQCMAGKTGSLKLLNIDTSQTSLDETIETIFAWLDS